MQIAPANTAEAYLDPEASPSIPSGPVEPQIDPNQVAADVLDAAFLPLPRVFLGVELWSYSNAIRQLIAQLSEDGDSAGFFQMIALRVVFDVGRHYAALTAPGADPTKPPLPHEAARRQAFRRVLIEAARRDDYRVDVLLWQEEMSEAQIKEGRRHINEIFAASRPTELTALDAEGGGGNG